ncbi:MAG: PEP-CTERM sorting domain-containing protein [Myxococcota bacterium]
MNALRRIVVGLAFLVAMQGASAAQAQLALGRTFDLRSEDYSLWSLFGTALYQESEIPGYTSRVLILTGPQQSDAAAAAFSSYQPVVDLNQPFTVYFYFFMAPGQVLSGDGMTFIMTSSAPALGVGGSDLGYGGSGLDGFAFGIDTFSFGDEVQAPSIQILANGSSTPVAAVPTGLPSLMDPTFFTWVATVSYEPSGNEDETGTLTGRLDQAEGELVFTVSAPVDWSSTGQAVFDPTTEQYVGRKLRFGFSAGTGLADDGHFVLALTPAPEPGLAAMLLVGTAFLGSIARRRPRA